jgi:RNA polymerase sigma-70 factor (ECF subfamily)
MSAAARRAAKPMAATTASNPSLGDHDADLVERHRYGDEAAFAEVYQRYSEMVYNLSLRLSGDPAEAEDLSQEIFLRVYRHLGRFRGGASLKTWVYRVALNHCRSRLGRRRAPGQPLPEAGSRGEPADPQRGPEERAAAADEGRRVARALLRVPPRFREALVLRDLEGLSYQEVAAVLGVRLGTVRSRIARGRDRLRQVLEETR